MLRILTSLFVILLSTTGLARAGGITADAIAPHRALYEIVLTSAKSGGQLSNLSGRMFFEWRRDCDAWTTDNRSILHYTYADGTASRINSDFATREDLNGKNFDFSTRRVSDGSTLEEYRGHASNNKAVYTVPAGHVVNLPKGTMFPMQHTMEILDRMQRGDRYFSVPLFDGSDDKNPPEVSVFIGAPSKAPTPLYAARNVDQGLLASPAHRMHIAFFPTDDDSGDAADYEMDMIAHNNGVVSDIDIVYDNFSVKQRLVALEKLERPASCSKKAN